MKNISYLIVTFCLISLISNAQSGTLDESFSNNGKVFNETFTGNCTVLVIQNDGKIVTGGFHDSRNSNEVGFIIARFNSNGTLDESFGEMGKTIIANVDGKRVTEIVSLVIQEDGKLVALGSFSNFFDIGVVRLNVDGTIDSSFSDNGILTINIGDKDIPGDIVIQPDGKMLITGMKGETETEHDGGFVMRLLANGMVDESFGMDGIVLISVLLPIKDINAITLQNDNKILVGGGYFGNTIFLIRFLNNGTIDNTFDEDKDGIAGIKFDSGDISYAGLNKILVQPDEKIVVAGSAANHDYRMAIARFNSDGSVDSAFGDNIGYSVLEMSSGYSIARTVNIEANKKIILNWYIL